MRCQECADVIHFSLDDNPTVAIFVVAGNFGGREFAGHDPQKAPKDYLTFQTHSISYHSHHSRDSQLKNHNLEEGVQRIIAACSLRNSLSKCGSKAAFTLALASAVFSGEAFAACTQTTPKPIN
jgi:hypothetical protein